MTNAELKLEADELMRRCGLAELLSVYPEWCVGGSYSYDLMCWRDLDVYALDPTGDLKRCFNVGYELTAQLTAKKSRFTDNRGGTPDGFYWGIKLGDERRGAWKLDVWFLNRRDYDRHRDYSISMNARLTDETRAAILAIKRDSWQRPEYRDTITGDLIYQAVFDHGVRGTDDFERFLKHAALH